MVNNVLLFKLGALKSRIEELIRHIKRVGEYDNLSEVPQIKALIDVKLESISEKLSDITKASTINVEEVVDMTDLLSW